MAFTNAAQPRIVGWRNTPYRVEHELAIGAGIAVGDFVQLTSGAWAVWADSGSNAMGGIYLGRDPGSYTTGSVVLPTPGVNAAGTGIFGGDGPVASATLGAVAVISPELFVEVDILEGTTMTTIVPGFTGFGIGGATYVSPSSGGWYIDLNANTTVDSIAEIVEVLYPAQAALRGRAIIRFHDATKLNPGG